ncbi:MAG TPA: hypothetical protein VL625_04560 [Patescibacteria group bacterium]|nr:hypothetical protein [Patescibacteria group bacterium]
MALEKIFASATDEDKRREGQKAELDRVIAERGGEIVTDLKNIHTASKAARKASRFLSDDATELRISLTEYVAGLDEKEERLEKTYFLGNTNYGRGISITFRDNGTMKIEQQNKHYVPAQYKNGDPAAILKTDRNVVYDGAIDADRAQKEIGVFVSQAMHESARQKLQTALAAITPASGSSPRP